MNDDSNSEFIPRDQGGMQPPARPDEVLPDTLQLIPLSTRPYFPVLVQPVVVDSKPWGEGIKVVAESARARTESRGAHYRLDYEKRDDEQWLHHTMAFAGDKVELRYRPVTIFYDRYPPQERKY